MAETSETGLAGLVQEMQAEATEIATMHSRPEVAKKIAELNTLLLDEEHPYLVFTTDTEVEHPKESERMHPGYLSIAVRMKKGKVITYDADRNLVLFPIDRFVLYSATDTGEVTIHQTKRDMQAPLQMPLVQFADYALQPIKKPDQEIYAGAAASKNIEDVAKQNKERILDLLR